MASDTELAFDHPEARARATTRGALRDRISLRDHVAEVEIGAFQGERGRTQRLRFNIVVEVRSEPGAGDDVDRILSYDTLLEAIAAALAAERLNLLETLAERVAAGILAAPQALRVFVRIEKLDRGPGALGVEIVREPGDLAPLSEQGAAPAPQVVALSEEALASPHLGAWIDRLEADPDPAILCVGVPDLALPDGATDAIRQRIELLAIGQNAWRLSGRDPRAIVVESRTELDWALRHGQITVWAPFKMVMDALEPPPGGPRDTAGLAAWLAGRMQARRLLLIGPPAPRSAPEALPILAASPDHAELPA